jgi:ABC-type lipoprotein export system ATPase subunit
MNKRKPTHIEQFRIKHYRSCMATVFDPKLLLSVFIGPNGSGKTNALNAMLLLKKILTLGSRFQREESGANECVLAVRFRVDGKKVLYKARVKYSTDEQNLDIVATADEQWNLYDITGKKSWIRFPLALLDISREWRHGVVSEIHAIRAQVRYRRLYGPPLSRKLFSGDVPFSAVPLLRKIYEFISGTRYYSASQFTSPSECPVSFEIDEDGNIRRTYRSARPHVRFMFDLYSSHKRNDNDYKEFLSVIGKDGLNLISTINYREIVISRSRVEVKTGGRSVKKNIEEKIVVPTFGVGGNRLSPNQLSEGTFKTVALVFYLITDSGRFLLIEEPEVCVHHGLLSSIIELIKDFSERKQIIVTTHSDYVLDRLSPLNVFLVKNYKTKGTIIESIPKTLSANGFRALREYLDKTGNLGEFWRHGNLEK